MKLVTQPRYDDSLLLGYIPVEPRPGAHAGFGLGLINSADFVETEDDGAEGEFDSEYEGWRFYLKTWF